MILRETVAQISAVKKEAKGFPKLCNLRNSVGNRAQTFLCMPEQSRTTETATLTPQNHTRKLGATTENPSN